MQRIKIRNPNNPVKFHFDPTWNDGALGFFEESRPNTNNKKKNKMSSDMRSVPDPTMLLGGIGVHT